MPTIDQAYDWLIALSPLALYAAAFGLAFIENVFPPFPSDLFIGLCAFIAAPGESSLLVTYACVIVGNVSGAAAMHWLGRRYGADGLQARLEARGLLAREAKLQAMYARYGTLALFVGRLIPGVRGIVPMFAGALRVGAARTLIVTGIAATLWYGVLMFAAYRVGGNWEEYANEIVSIGRWGAIIGGSIAAACIAVLVLVVRKVQRDNPDRGKIP